MSIRLLAKSFQAAAAIGGYLIVCGNNGTDQVKLATAATDPLLGTADSLGASASDMLDIVLVGESEVLLGGTVELGDPITSDANSKGIKAAAAAGTNKRIIGFATQRGVAGDVVRYLVAPGLLYTPA